MSRKFGHKFAPRRRQQQTKPGRCDRCRTNIPVHASRYPLAGIGTVCQPCRERIVAPPTPAVTDTADNPRSTT